jgi:hypothetical protein
MNRLVLCSLVATVAVGAVVAVPRTASAAAWAWWARTPGATCVPVIQYQSSGGPDDSTTDAMLFELIGQATGTLVHTQAVCPFPENEIRPDSNITAIAVDLYNPSGATIAAGALSAEACVFSGWVASCGSSVSSAAITSGGHDGLSITDLSKWTGDTGNGYAAVVLFEADTDTSWVGGVDYTGSNSGGI